MSGKRYPRLVIRNAMVVDGNGTPASGPKDIVIEGNTIGEVVPLDPVALREGRAKRPVGDVEIDYTDTGSGPVVVFVHGAYVTGRLWQDVVDRLSGSHRCIAPTLPFGAQAGPGRGSRVGRTISS